MLKSLHGVGTARDKAGNHERHLDQYCVLVLMWMFNEVFQVTGQIAYLKNLANYLATHGEQSTVSKR